MQLADITTLEVVSWWFESTRRHHAGVMQLADIAALKAAFWWFDSTHRQISDITCATRRHDGGSSGHPANPSITQEILVLDSRFRVT